MPPPTIKGRLDISKLSKPERRRYEERRKDWLLSHFGTEEQKRKLAHVANGKPPYNIFHDIPETAPSPPPVPISNDWQLFEAAEEPPVAPDSDNWQLNQPSAKNGEVVSSDRTGLGNDGPVVAPGHQQQVSQKDLEDQPYSIVNDEIVFNSEGGLVQATAKPLAPTLNNVPQAHDTFGSLGGSGHRQAASVLLWWIVFFAVVVLVVYRFASSKWRRRKYYGS
ncbi:MAG: hypothetical protein M1814_002865 [Vezdaea aestivalis]|nr:MAG: hypothetical protein M1814_002865 [Vezdaea aestivalis]